MSYRAVYIFCNSNNDLIDNSSCESVICPSDLFCGLGYKKDDSGCEICECKGTSVGTTQVVIYV